MTEDKSDFNKLTMMDRRKFLGGLLAVGAASSVLPVGVNEYDIEIKYEDYDTYDWRWHLLKLTMHRGKVVKAEVVRRIKDVERDDAGNYLLTT